MEVEIKDYINDKMHTSDHYHGEILKSLRDELKQHEINSQNLRVQFYKDMNETVRTSLVQVVKETVNGKIDRMTQKLDDHMVRVEPAIVAYEESQITSKVLGRRGEILVKWSGVITAVGIIGGAFILIITNFI